MPQPNYCRCDAQSLVFEYVSWRYQLTTIFFMLIWEAAWTGASVLLVLQAIVKNEAPLWFICFIFVLSWFFGLGLLLYLLFGKQTGKLDLEGFRFHRRIICITSEKTIPLAELRGFRLEKEVSRSSKGGTSITWLVVLETTERPLRIAAQNKRIDLHDWLVENGNSILKTLKTGRAANSEATKEETISLPAFRNLEQGANLNDSEDELAETDDSDVFGPDLDASGKVEELYPLDDSVPAFRQSVLSRWTKSDELSELVFTSRGRLQFDSLLTWGFVCLFWNGIVCVFLYALFFESENVQVAQLSSYDWLNNLITGVFFTPFILVGLVLFCVTLNQLFAPIIIRRITFTRTEVRNRTSVWGIPVSRQFNIESVEAFAINDSGKSNRLNDSCQLTFLNVNGDKLGKIKDLTLADARWLMVEFRHLFGR